MIKDFLNLFFLTSGIQYNKFFLVKEEKTGSSLIFFPLWGFFLGFLIIKFCQLITRFTNFNSLILALLLLFFGVFIIGGVGITSLFNTFLRLTKKNLVLFIVCFILTVKLITYIIVINNNNFDAIIFSYLFSRFVFCFIIFLFPVASFSGVIKSYKRNFSSKSFFILLIFFCFSLIYLDSIIFFIASSLALIIIYFVAVIWNNNCPGFFSENLVALIELSELVSILSVLSIESIISKI